MRKFVDDLTIENGLEQVWTILETVGIAFESASARETFRRHGAAVEGNRVRIPRPLAEKALAAAVKQEYGAGGRSRVAAVTPFCNAPFLLDDETGVMRRCTVADAIKMYQLNETSELYENANPGCADPLDNDGDDPFVAQIAMALKYSDKPLSIGLRATGSNARGGDVYASARKAFRLAREFYDIWDEPVLTQGVCPNPPLAYDEESLSNLHAAVDEKQAISLFPCSISFMTGPERIMDLVLHDFALALAGLIYVQLLGPGLPVYLSEFSAVSDIRTLQPAYGTPESVFTQIIFYELARRLQLPCSVCGGYGDGTSVDYQAGLEGMMTILLPFQLTELEELWCYPGLMSGFAGSSFYKALLDEEAIRYANRILRGADTQLNPKLPELLEAGRQEGSFLGVGSMADYRREQYLSPLFNKGGMARANQAQNVLRETAGRLLAERLAAYEPPARSESQLRLLRPYLPSQCR